VGYKSGGEDGDQDSGFHGIERLGQHAPGEAVIQAAFKPEKYLNYFLG
jgi:hypothetical protein